MVTPSLWVDTNVILDFYTDFRVYDNQTVGGNPAVEATRMMMQNAAWMAIALDEQRAATVTYWHEVKRNLLQKAPPGSERGSFVHQAIWIVKDHVAPAWTIIPEHKGETTIDGDGLRPTTRDERDQIIVDESKARGLSVITRDKGVRKRAGLAAVVSMEPQDYAAPIISAAQARTRFLDRLELGIEAWLTNYGHTQPDSRHACDLIRAIYRVIWAPPGAFTPGAPATP